MLNRKSAAIIFLLVFTPVFAESVASTNTPWPSLLNPKIFLFMVALYGVSALVLRELWVRKKVGFSQFIVYGAFFAALNEGLVANTWFKLNPLNFKGGELARYGGVNWHMVINLIMFHTLFSMLIPILISFLVSPKLQKQPLLSTNSLRLCLGLLMFIGIGSLLPKHGVAADDIGHRLLLLLLVVIGFVVLHRQQPQPLDQRSGQLYNPRKLVAAGFGFSVLFTMTYFVLPALFSQSALFFSACLLVGTIVFAHIVAAGARSDFRVILPVTGGLLIPSLFFSFAKLSIGQPFLVIAFVYWLWYLYQSSNHSIVA